MRMIKGRLKVQWMKQLPTTKQLQMEKILDQKLSRKPRKHDYYEYLVKWKDLPTEDATWMSVAEIQKHGKQVEDLMEGVHEYFFLWESDAGASTS
jgi:hypothetical protein